MDELSQIRLLHKTLRDSIRMVGESRQFIELKCPHGASKRRILARMEAFDKELQTVFVSLKLEGGEKEGSHGRN